VRLGHRGRAPGQAPCAPSGNGWLCVARQCLTVSTGWWPLSSSSGGIQTGRRATGSGTRKAVPIGVLNRQKRGVATYPPSERSERTGPTNDQVMIHTHDVRIVASNGGYILETRRAGDWHREVGCDTLDEAVETAARQQVERRFRSGHHRIPLSDRTALVFVRQRWWLETKSRVRGEVSRSKSWPNIYRRLCSGTRGGIAGQHADPIRRALWDIHVETVATLRDAAVEPSREQRAAA
jgi:hypothetical protein